MTVDGKDIEVVTKFVFLGKLVTEDGLCEKELRRRIAMGKAAMGGLTFIYLFIYLLNIFKQGRTFRQNHCFTMLPYKEHLKIRQ